MNDTSEPTYSNSDDEIACPICEEKWGDLWDYDWNTECIETECPCCSAHITLCAEYSVDYTCYAGWKSEEGKNHD